MGENSSAQPEGEEMKRSELFSEGNLKSYFGNHVAQVRMAIGAIDEESLIHLRWAMPDSNFSRVDYIIRRGYLYVSGDLGEAIYQWNSMIDLKFLAECDLDYFASKCQASEKGTHFEHWYREKAEHWIRNNLKELATEYEGLPIYEQEQTSLIGSCGLEDEWRHHLEHMDEDDRTLLFGEEWYDYLNIGNDVHIRLWLHWQGLKLAYKQLEEKK